MICNCKPMHDPFFSLQQTHKRRINQLSLVPIQPWRLIKLNECNKYCLWLYIHVSQRTKKQRDCNSRKTNSNSTTNRRVRLVSVTRVGIVGWLAFFFLLLEKQLVDQKRCSKNYSTSQHDREKKRRIQWTEVGSDGWVVSSFIRPSLPHEKHRSEKKPNQNKKRLYFIPGGSTSCTLPSIF